MQDEISKKSRLVIKMWIKEIERSNNTFSSVFLFLLLFCDQERLSFFLRLIVTSPRFISGD